MAARRALYLALDLATTPVLASAMREQALPPDVFMLIQIAAGNPETSREAAEMTGKHPDVIREAAILYIQQVLLSAEADNYRVLGVASDAPQDLLRRHMRWLMKGLHPDHSRSDWESVFAERVLGAWQDLKSTDRRARYDRSLKRLRPAGAAKLRRTSDGKRPVRRIPLIAAGRKPSPPLPSHHRWPLVGATIAATVVLAALLWPGWKSPLPRQSPAEPGLQSGATTVFGAASTVEEPTTGQTGALTLRPER